MARPRILIFSTAYLPLVGGAEISIREVVDRLPEYDFDLITARIERDLPVEETVGRIKVYRLGFGSPLDKFLLPIWGWFFLKRLKDATTYNLLWAVMASQAAVLAAWATKIFPNAPLILTLQEGDEEEYLKRYVGGSDILYKFLIRPWYWLPFKKAAAITALSNYLIQRAAAVPGAVPAILVPNGVDFDHFSRRPPEMATATLARLIGKEPGDTVLINVSRFVTKNGVADTIKALEFLPKTTKLILVGDGPLRDELEKLATPFDLGKRVFFFGQASHTDLPTYLSVADVFVRPSLSEGFGLSFVEAMAAELPVIGTPVGGIPDFLIAGKTGWLAEPNNPHSIAVAVGAIIDPKKATQKAKIVAAAKQRASDYDWPKVAAQYRELFERMLYSG